MLTPQIPTPRGCDRCGDTPRVAVRVCAVSPVGHEFVGGFCIWCNELQERVTEQLEGKDGTGTERRSADR